MQTVEGILNEPQVNFVGKDGFFWWVGEVEDNEDPMELGRCKVRVLGYYTNVRGGTVADLPTDNLPWATVLQHACQAGNDGQGESAGQLQLVPLLWDSSWMENLLKCRSLSVFYAFRKERVKT